MNTKYVARKKLKNSYNTTFVMDALNTNSPLHPLFFKNKIMKVDKLLGIMTALPMEI